MRIHLICPFPESTHSYLQRMKVAGRGEKEEVRLCEKKTRLAMQTGEERERVPSINLSELHCPTAREKGRLIQRRRERTQEEREWRCPTKEENSVQISDKNALQQFFFLQFALLCKQVCFIGVVLRWERSYCFCQCTCTSTLTEKHLMSLRAW